MSTSECEQPEGTLLQIPNKLIFNYANEAHIVFTCSCRPSVLLQIDPRNQVKTHKIRQQKFEAWFKPLTREMQETRAVQERAGKDRYCPRIPGICLIIFIYPALPQQER